MLKNMELTVSDIFKKYPEQSDAFIKEQLNAGIEQELIHGSAEEAKQIVLEHLNENIRYYQYLTKMEEQMKIDSHFQEHFANGGKLNVFSFNTPTGKPSKLTYIQQVLVRTSHFKKFFGDWELAAKTYAGDNLMNFNQHFRNVSKLIDEETLEPSLLFHGTASNQEFFKFDTTRENRIGRPYAYFAYNREYSENFTTSSQRGNNNAIPILYSVFVNVRNPFYANTPDFEDKNADAEYWLDKISERIMVDKYRSADNSLKKAMRETIDSQIGGYIRNIYQGGPNKFWRLMSSDIDKDFKFFLIAYGYDGVLYDEEFLKGYDKNNPAEYTQAVTIFDSKQVKLADGRNTNFDSLNPDIRFEDGGKIDEEHEKVEENEHHIHIEPSKREKLDRIILGHEHFADGGKVKGDGNHPHDAKKGGFFQGKSHAEGGIKAINKDTGQIIEVEGNEVIINKKSVADPRKREFEGEMLTNKEILSRINESGGGVSFEKGGELCLCGKQYKYGGETVDDYTIAYRMSQVDKEIDEAKDYINQIYK
jgi:hypothetical protein